MSDSPIPARYQAVHAAGGALLYAALGAAWALVGALELRPWGEPWVNIALGLITGVLLIVGVRALQRASQLPEDEITEIQIRERESRSRRSHRVLSAQGLVITVVSAALLLADRYAYIAAATSLAVGLHFIALAAVHKHSGEYVVGGLMIAVALGAMYWIPRSPAIPIGAMNMVAGLGTATILWGGSAFRLLWQERLWRQTGARRQN